MINYFFISSPLHFFIATNLAISHDGDTNVAIFMSKNKKMAQQYSKATLHFNDVFQETHDLSINEEHGKFSQRKISFSLIKNIIKSKTPNRIFTGNDRRMEFQYAMHQTKQLNTAVEGIYIDDGVISYLGHKSINNVFHKYIDPILKKLLYGNWWKNALTTGSSSWITKAYLAVPQNAFPLLKSKELVPLDQSVFSSSKFLAINSFLIAEYNLLDDIDFSSIKAVLCLPHESVYTKNKKLLSNIQKSILQKFSPSSIAIKGHPRSKNTALLSDTFPGSITLPNTLGMELLLPNLTDNTVIIGDVSTALLTAKWLKPHSEVFAYEVNATNNSDLKSLFKSLGISFISLGSP